jgi:hypothetical protein
MQNNTLMLNNIILEEIIKAKLLAKRDKPTNTSKLNERLKFDELRINISKLNEQTDNEYLNKAATALKVVSPVVGGFLADPAAKLGSAALNKSSYDSAAAKRIRLQIKAATELQKQLNSTTQSGLLDSPARQKEYMSYMRSKAAYDKLPANEKPKYFLPWKNTAADSFFKKIVNAGTGALTGIFKRLPNPDLQYYSYQILMIAANGKTRCVVQFHPDGTCNISDEGPLAVSSYNYSIKGGKLYITQPDIDKWIMKCTPDSYYLVAEFNPELSDQVFDPYKGAGFWRSMSLDLQGFSNEKYWATRKNAQQEYNKSWTAVLDKIQTVGDWAGLIPGYGDVIDVINALVYFGRGKNFEGCLSLIAIIPMVGSVIKIGVKNGVKALRVNSKVGLDAMDEILTNPSTIDVFLDFLAKNKVARDAVKSFVKNIHKASAWRGILTGTFSILKWIPGGGMVIAGLKTMMAKYGKSLDDYIKSTATTLEQTLEILNAGRGAAPLGGKLGREAAENDAKILADEAVELSKLIGKPLRKKLVQGIGNTIRGAATMLDKLLLRVVGPDFFNALSRGMSDSFVKWASKLKFNQYAAIIRASPGGMNLFFAALKNYDTIILKYFLDNNIMSNIVKATDLPAAQWDALITYIRSADNIKLSGVMAHIKKSFGKNAERYMDLQYRIIVSLISEGNAVYKLWCMEFWNMFKAAMPWAIHKWSSAKNIAYIQFSVKEVPIYLKYAAGKGNMLTKEIAPILKFMDDYLKGAIGAFIRVPMTLLLKALDGLTNLKRLDILWNELQEFFEGTTGKDLSVDEKQSVIVSVINYCTGGLAYDMINWLIKIIKPIIPGGIIPVNKPTEIPMVKNQGFQKKLNDQ